MSKVIPKSKFVLAIPCYNKSTEIEEVVRQSFNIISSIPDITFKIVVIDDCSTDGSKEIIKDLPRKYPGLSIILNEKNLGKGQSLNLCWRKYESDFFGFIDGDLDLSVDSLRLCIDLIKSNPNVSAVVGSKLHKDSKVEYPKLRKILSRIVQTMNKVFFNLPISDTQVGIKVFRTSEFDNALKLSKSKGFTWDIEMLSLRNRGRIIDVPVNLNFNFTSSIRLKTIISFMYEYLYLIYRIRKHLKN
jgi:glycosyltransferase involved in cell wall biosynthesis